MLLGLNRNSISYCYYPYWLLAKYAKTTPDNGWPAIAKFEYINKSQVKLYDNSCFK